MSYIVRVVGYDAFWTGDTTPGSCWSTSIEESKKFDTLEEAEKIVNSGINMQAIEYNSAISDSQQSPPDWDEIDRKLSEIKNKENKKEEIIELNDFETTSTEVHNVNVEIVE